MLVAHPSLETLRPLIQQLPLFEMRNLDNLRKYALATWLTNNRNLPKSERKREVDRLLARAIPIRDRLFIAAPSLVFDRVLDKAQVESIERRRGPRRVAGDIEKLASMYLAAGDAITGKSIVTIAMAREAEILATRLMGLASLDDSVDFDRVKAIDDFVRAFFLLDRAYTQCRRAADYLCFGDPRLATLVPNYYAVQRRKVRRKAPPAGGGGAPPAESGNAPPSEPTG